jgi:tetrahydromethanopterin S-methyltransferase subunit G
MRLERRFCQRLTEHPHPVRLLPAPIMPLSLPSSVRESLGTPASDDFEEWIRSSFAEQTVSRDEYREVLSRLDAIESDLDHFRREVDARFEQVNTRFNQVDERFEEIDRRFEQVDARFEQVDERFDKVDQRFNRMDARFDRFDDKLDAFYDRLLVMVRWTVGSIALIGSLITILLAVSEFT